MSMNSVRMQAFYTIQDPRQLPVFRDVKKKQKFCITVEYIIS